MKDWHPNPRIREAMRNGDRIAICTSVPKCANPEQIVECAGPMPGVVILVHGVNDVGEAYATQAKGLCEGLNQRLGRTDLTPGNWDVARACRDNRVASYERRADQQGYNPIIPFYWGYRPVDKATYEADRARYREELARRGAAGADAPYDAYYIDGKSDPRRGFENVDCFDNRLDEHFAKNGGVFANATTSLIDMWGPGGDIFGLARWISSMGQDLSHTIPDAPHRIYMVNAAQRLANLILMIRRDNETTKNDSINIVAHSQGTLIAMLANFLVANGARPTRPADCLILNHSPYSLETPSLEAMQSHGPQQSRRARTETLVNICQLIGTHRKPGPTPETLACSGVAAQRIVGTATHVRDNHGKVFNYFCPHDQTVSLRNVQGMGWQGVPPAVAARCAPALAQRIFLDGRAMHSPPGPITLPDLKRTWLGVASNSDVPDGQVRDINAPALPDLGYTFALPAGCDTLGSSDWGVQSAAAAVEGENHVQFQSTDPRPGVRPLPRGYQQELLRTELAELEAAFAARGEHWTLVRATANSEGLFVTRYMTPEELRERARDTSTTTSNHSAIVLDEAASRCATAFDLAVGRCRSYDTGKLDGGAFWQKLLR
ncbi:T6SS effector phospholipase Tle3 domain-containing protein, partial [Denitromonas halophila]